MRAENRQPKSDNRNPKVENRQPKSESRKSVLGYRFSVLCFRLSVLGFLFLVLSSSLALAGGPWFVDTINNSGTPARWPYNSSTGKWVMRWRSDPGPLTSGSVRVISSIRGVEDWVKPMLRDWQNVKLPFQAGEDPVTTVALDIIYEGSLETVSDLTSENYQDYAFDFDPAANFPTVVIFDVDGEIVRDYCLTSGGSTEECGGAPGASSCPEMGAMNCIAGLAQPFTDHTDRLIKRGFIILNGRLINDISTSTDNEADPDQFKAVIKHELGHLLNLDHSQVNAELAESCAEDDCTGGEAIGTMFPVLKTIEQYTLHVDDKVGISWLYPTSAFRDNFCVIVGEVQNEEGKGMQGVNIIARSVNDPLVDARTMVSGVLYPPGSENGQYILSGIIPQVDYEVVYEELLAHYNEQAGSQFGPLGPTSPQDFGTGLIKGPDGKAQFHCEEGGDVIEMEALKISLTEDRAISGMVTNLGEGYLAGTSQKKGWCQLMPNQTFDPLFCIGVASFVLILFGLRLKLRSVGKNP